MQAHQRRHPLTITIPDSVRGKVQSNAKLSSDRTTTQHGHLTRHHEHLGKSIGAIHKYWHSGDPRGYTLTATSEMKLSDLIRVAKLLQVLEIPAHGAQADSVVGAGLLLGLLFFHGTLGSKAPF